MISEKLWDNIISKLTSSENEIQTTTGLWFKAYVKEQRLFVDKANNHYPSSKLTKPRTITKKDFLLVHSYYKTDIQKEASKKSKNTAYIFALINYYR
ncbi:MAG: hypothetical protein AB7V16_01375 [Vulcanibacillus sp.]